MGKNVDMTKHESDDIQIPDRAKDQPAEGGRPQAEQAEKSRNTGKGAEHSPATGPEGIDSHAEGLEERMPRGGEPPA